jgi:hypothetical protein
VLAVNLVEKRSLSICLSVSGDILLLVSGQSEIESSSLVLVVFVDLL